MGYDGSSFTTFSKQGSPTYAAGINPSGLVVGTTGSVSGTVGAWIRQPNGTLTPLNDPAKSGVETPEAINDNGVVLGLGGGGYFTWRNGTGPRAITPP